MGKRFIVLEIVDLCSFLQNEWMKLTEEEGGMREWRVNCFFGTELEWAILFRFFTQRKTANTAWDRTQKLFSHCGKGSTVDANERRRRMSFGVVGGRKLLSLHLFYCIRIMDGLISRFSKRVEKEVGEWYNNSWVERERENSQWRWRQGALLWWKSDCQGLIINSNSPQQYNTTIVNAKGKMTVILERLYALAGSFKHGFMW